MHIYMCIYSRYKTLTGRFFITGSTIDLSGKKEILDHFCLQRMMQLSRIKEIILNRISRTIKHYIL